MSENPTPRKGADFQSGSQIVLKKLNVALENPVNLSRRSNPVIETEALSVLSAGWTNPSVIAATVSVRVTLRQPNQISFGLAFFPSRSIGSDYKEIRGMKDAKTFPICRIKVELNRRCLVIIFEYLVVVLQFVYRGQLNAVALKLDRKSHFSAGITSGDVRMAAAHPPRRIRTPNTSDYA